MRKKERLIKIFDEMFNSLHNLEPVKEIVFVTFNNGDTWKFECKVKEDLKFIRRNLQKQFIRDLENIISITSNQIR